MKTLVYIIVICVFGLISTCSKKTQTQTHSARDTLNLTCQEIQFSGLDLYLKNTSNEVVVFKVFWDGGLWKVPANHPEIERITLMTWLDSGSENYPKQEFRNRLDSLAAEVSVSFQPDYSVLTIKSVRKNWEKSWQLLCDFLLHPNWDSTIFEQKKIEIMSQAAVSQTQVEAKARRFIYQSIFQNHPYRLTFEGDYDSIPLLSEEMARQWQKMMQTKQSFKIVVVGNILAEEWISKINGTIDQLPDAKRDTFTSIQTIQPGIFLAKEDIPYTMLRAAFAGADAKQIEVLWLDIAISLLNDRLQTALIQGRENPLCQQVSAAFSIQRTPYGMISIVTEQPKEAIQQILQLIQFLHKEGFSEDEVLLKKESWLTRFYLGIETNAAKAEWIGSGLCLKNSHLYSPTTLDKIRQVKASEVNAVFRKYVTALSWSVVGKLDDLQSHDFILRTE
ncbi:MAG: insulinase family protein [Bacteroidia bacterium]|nr:insulinase family protein [Bacteroidia bacterium]